MSIPESELRKLRKIRDGLPNGRGDAHPLGEDRVRRDAQADKDMRSEFVRVFLSN